MAKKVPKPIPRKASKKPPTKKVVKAAKKRPPIKASLWHAALCVVISSRNNTYLEIQRLRDNEPTLTAHLENLHGAILATEVTLAQQLSDHGHVLPTGCYYETLKKRQ